MATDPSRRKTKSLQDILRMSELQKELLSVGLNSLKKEGILVYSTCSTAPEENEEIIHWALSSFPIRILDSGFSNFSPGLTSAFGKEFHPDLQKAVRLYPHKHGTEGFFVCKLKLLEEVT